jgi:hypothetical protein
MVFDNRVCMVKKIFGKKLTKFFYNLYQKLKKRGVKTPLFLDIETVRRPVGHLFI